mmetsp:Transcript_67878/g.78925  ORF Transcript_67878/g.78925 Transcript_67878/m.78925 type:complete len:262 (-) Transcript_67878:92-877(-)
MCNIDNLHHDGLQSRVEQIGLEKRVLELGGTGEHKTRNIRPVVGDEVLRCRFGDLSKVVVPPLLANTGKTILGLTTSAVLLWELNAELAELFLHAAANRRVQRTRTVDNNEAKLLIGLEHAAELVGVEFVVAQVQATAHGLKWFNVHGELFLLVVLCENRARVQNQAVVRDAGDQLQAPKCRGNGRLDRKLVGVGLNVRSSAKLVVQHRHHSRHLILGRDVDSDHAGSHTTSRLQHLDELLHLVALNVLFRLRQFNLSHCE